MQGKKRGAGFKELAEWISAHPPIKAILLVIDCPDLLWHIYEQAGKRCGDDKSLLRYYFRKLVKLGLVRCLTPELKGTQPGRIYALTNKGIEIRKILCQKDRIEFVYRRLRGIDWHKYGRVVLGQQRIALLKVLDTAYSQRFYEIVEKISINLNYKTRAQTQGMAYQNVNKTLHWLVQEGLVMPEEFPGKKKRHKPVRRYRLASEGELMKKQIMVMAV